MNTFLSQKTIDRLKYWRIAASDYVKSHVILLVILALIAVWFITSVGVYICEYGEESANIHSFGDSLWWGIVTLLTVGYGDRFPVTTEGRFIGGFLMCSGVLAISVVTAKVSSILLEQALLEGRGMVHRDKLVDHYIVCGWKDDMRELLLHILDFNPKLSSHQIVILANVQQSVIDDLRSVEKLRDVKFITGNAYQQSTLDRAAPEKARRILILADRGIGENGVAATEAEADARTVMTAITLSNVARHTLVTAELLDPRLAHYLEMAGVSDIIFSREYSRLLLSNASSATGLSNVIHDLLDPSESGFICTIPIDESYLNRTFGDYKKEFEQTRPYSAVVGILENTGNPYHIKEQAIRAAQKTASVQNLVNNLHAAKNLRCNNPVFMPADDYKIGAGAAAIVIENRARMNTAGEHDPRVAA